MKSTFLILSAAACYSVCPATAAEGENYSLWPKRPPEIEQSGRLVRAQKYDEAVELLKQHTTAEGVVGREARKISSALQVPKYLSRRNPYATLYTVRAGDTLHRIVNTTQCPSEMVMLLNGISEPSSLKVGQRIVVVKMALRAEIYPHLRELCVWDDDVLVASYDIESHNLPHAAANVQTKVEQRDGLLKGEQLPRRSTQFLSSERILRLAGGLVIAGTPQENGQTVCLKKADVNELALLLSPGAEVVIVYEQ